MRRRSRAPSVTGTLTYGGVEHEVEGEGYHDHNWGDFSYPKYLSRWHWGRIITDPASTLVFADIVTTCTSAATRACPYMLIARGDRLAFETYEMEWQVRRLPARRDGACRRTRATARLHLRRARRQRAASTSPRSRCWRLDDLLKDAKVPARGWRAPSARTVRPARATSASTPTYEGEIDFGGRDGRRSTATPSSST